MATAQLTDALRHLRQAVLAREDGLPDGKLLERYLARRDEAAFEALVRRHGPMVLGVCRRLLRDAHDADDAFQATFLVLVRKAHSIRPRNIVGNWLHGVAYRTALKARAVNARRRTSEWRAVEIACLRPQRDGSREELLALLDQELGRLPERYRGPVVLCHLEGKTRKEAARQLGWPEGTVAIRLSGARKLLAKRLARHGLVSSGGSLAAVLAAPAAAASLPALLLARTVKSAAPVAAGQAVAPVLISTRVTSLTEGVLQAMLVGKLKTALVVLLVAGIFGVGLGVAGFFYPARAADDLAPREPLMRAAPAPATDHETVPRPQPSASARPPVPPDDAAKPAVTKDFVVSLQYFDVELDGLARTTSPHHRFAIPEGRSEKLLINGYQRAMGFQTEQKLNLMAVEKAETSLGSQRERIGYRPCATESPDSYLPLLESGILLDIAGFLRA
jgi:RNA polymerase sigma-70 factor (ECF subfamily)